ncbi:hypothetical protein [Blastococcus litoris]|uniref:hypothetical protein n=1 Tax=Blastococcus litoris TaxID=2171622 RepID=UPI000E300BEE|nr:hypothetical protein [Blastococcus litoris]
MEAVGTRFEVRVGTLVNPAILAAFRLPLSRVAVPRNTLRRLRITADHDVPAVLSRLIESDVEVLEIRRCTIPSARADTTEPAPRTPPPVPAGTDGAAGVVLPFRGRSGDRRRPR